MLLIIFKPHLRRWSLWLTVAFICAGNMFFLSSPRIGRIAWEFDHLLAHEACIMTWAQYFRFVRKPHRSYIASDPGPFCMPQWTSGCSWPHGIPVLRHPTSKPSFFTLNGLRSQMEPSAIKSNLGRIQSVFRMNTPPLFFGTCTMLSPIGQVNTLQTTTRADSDKFLQWMVPWSPRTLHSICLIHISFICIQNTTRAPASHFYLLSHIVSIDDDNDSPQRHRIE